MSAWPLVSREWGRFDTATDDLAFVAPDNAALLRLRLLIRLRGAGEQALL